MRNSHLRATLLLLALLALAPAGAFAAGYVIVTTSAIRADGFAGRPHLGPAGLAALCLGLGLLGCAGAVRSRRRDVA